MAPEQEALYGLHWNVPRSELSMAAQLEYDRLRPAWERGEARPAAGELEAARLAWEQEYPPEHDSQMASRHAVEWSEPGARKIAAPYPRWEAVLGMLVAFLPWALLAKPRDNPTLLPLGQHVPDLVALLTGTAVFIWGCCRAWRMGLRLDDYGVTIRNFFRIYQFSWAEVRCFADGWVHEASEGRGADFWALDVVLHDGRVVTARCTMSKKARPKTLTAIQQAAARYAIPATLTGKVTKQGSQERPGVADAGDSTASQGDYHGEGPATG
jgi:hypothetical protein